MAKTISVIPSERKIKMQMWNHFTPDVIEKLEKFCYVKYVDTEEELWQNSEDTVVVLVDFDGVSDVNSVCSQGGADELSSKMVDEEHYVVRAWWD
jgi:hypothetical protein